MKLCERVDLLEQDLTYLDKVRRGNNLQLSFPPGILLES